MTTDDPPPFRPDLTGDVQHLAELLSRFAQRRPLPPDVTWLALIDQLDRATVDDETSEAVFLAAAGRLGRLAATHPALGPTRWKCVDGAVEIVRTSLRARVDRRAR